MQVPGGRGREADVRIAPAGAHDHANDFALSLETVTTTLLQRFEDISSELASLKGLVQPRCKQCCG